MSDETRVVRLGETVSGDEPVLWDLNVDHEKHPDGNGGARTSFSKGDDIYLLAHHASEIKIVRLVDTTGGDLLRLGEVTRTGTVRLSWASDDDIKDLPHLPSGPVKAKWYGRAGVLEPDGRSLTATGTPCLADVSYPYKAVQYRFRPSADISVIPGEQFPLEVWAETEE